MIDLGTMEQWLEEQYCLENWDECYSEVDYYEDWEDIVDYDYVQWQDTQDQ